MAGQLAHLSWQNTYGPSPRISAQSGLPPPVRSHPGQGPPWTRKDPSAHPVPCLATSLSPPGFCSPFGASSPSPPSPWPSGDSAAGSFAQQCCFAHAASCSHHCSLALLHAWSQSWNGLCPHLGCRYHHFSVAPLYLLE